MLSISYTEKLQRLGLRADDVSYKGTDPNLLLGRPCVAVVGSRKPTPYGKEITERFVAELSSSGVVILSGLAFGIDGLAHKSALKAGGTTVAVLPSGLETIYPTSHQMLAADIQKTGALLSTYPPLHQPHKHDFLNRNRLIVALCDAVIITEAAERSGSLNTARHAQVLAVPVYAVPGRVNDPMSKGTNLLIASGHAEILLSPSQILKQLSVDTTTLLKNTVLNLTEPAASIFNLVNQGIGRLFDLQLHSQLQSSQLLSTLTELELIGLIRQDSLGLWTIL